MISQHAVYASSARYRYETPARLFRASDGTPSGGSPELGASYPYTTCSPSACTPRRLQSISSSFRIRHRYSGRARSNVVTLCLPAISPSNTPNNVVSSIARLSLSLKIVSKARRQPAAFIFAKQARSASALALLTADIDSLSPRFRFPCLTIQNSHRTLLNPPVALGLRNRSPDGGRPRDKALEALHSAPGHI